MEIKNTTLFSKPELLDDVLKLIETSLNYSSLNQYKIDFLPLMAKNNFKHIHLLMNDSELVGVIGCYPGNLEFNGKTAPTISIGAICVAPHMRGNGIFKKYFQKIIDSYADKTSLFFLWSDLFDLYHKFHFFPALSQFESQGKWERAQENILAKGFVEFSDDDQNQTKHWEQIRIIWEKTTKRWWRFERNDLKWEQIKLMKSCHKFIRKNQNNIITDYFFIGKGEDLNNVIHEFGSINNLAHTLSQLSTARIWTPENPNLPTIFQEGNSTLVRAGSFKAFAQFIWDYTEGKIRLLSQHGNQICFEFMEKNHTIPLDEFIPGLLGPFPFKEMKDLQIPIFIGGLDSV